MADRPHDPLLVLLPSPLLGPAVWTPVAEHLGEAGWSVDVCRQPRGVTTAGDALAGFLEAVPADRPVVLVPHSNAGLFVPEVARQRPVVATVFVDAALPPPVIARRSAQPGSPQPTGDPTSRTSSGETTLAPSAFLDFLEGLADAEGLLPPWTRWWADTDVDVLFPDQATRLRVEREEQRLPLAYFRDTVAVPAGWTDSPNAYLAFGDTYADERRLAEQEGWPVVSLGGDHLHMLVAPAEVAAALTALLARLGVPAPTGPR
ncbi:hypothetical protein [Terrabacter terrigena]|uniref:Alpha/beta hydrolase n=1 Tax=Terrabacter terrigena TaxID=574718 RepID=A0ABW3MYP5_9MICO